MNVINANILSLNDVIFFIGNNYFNIITSLTIIILFYLLRKEYKKETNIIEEVNQACNNFGNSIRNNEANIYRLYEKNQDLVIQNINTEMENKLNELNKSMHAISTVYENSIIASEEKRIANIHQSISQPAQKISDRIKNLSHSIDKVYDKMKEVDDKMDSISDRQDILGLALNRKNRKIKELKKPTSTLKQ